MLDDRGLATVSITQVREITEIVRPSLACLVEHPFGLTLGAVGDQQTHAAVVTAALSEATRPHPSGTIVDLGYHWTHDDLRARQLRNEAD